MIAMVGKCACLLLLLSTINCNVAAFDLVTGGPPLLTTPVYSLATKAKTSTRTNMNLIMYATPLSIGPDRLWAIGLYKESYSYEIFKESGRGILQLLTPEHIPLVRLLGGTSGRNTDKEGECRNLDCGWQVLDKDQPLILPGCLSYLCLVLQNDPQGEKLLMDGGSHEIAICKVTDMFTDSDSMSAHLDTQTLRDLGIITKQGRIADFSLRSH